MQQAYAAQPAPRHVRVAIPYRGVPAPFLHPDPLRCIITLRATGIKRLARPYRL